LQERFHWPVLVEEDWTRLEQKLVRAKAVLSALSAEATARILECLGLPSRAPPLAPAVSDFTVHLDSF